MTRPITLGAGPIDLSFQAAVRSRPAGTTRTSQVSTDGGATFTSIHTSASTNSNENGQNFGYGITGTSGQPHVCDDARDPRGPTSPRT